MKGKIWLILAVATIITSRAQAGNIDFYSDAIIENGDVYNEVRVYDTAPEHTVVDMYGGSVNRLRTYDLSTANIYGGEISQTIEARNSSTVNIYCGHVSLDYLAASNSGSLNIYGGDLIVGNSPYFSDSSTVNIYGYGFERGINSLTGFLSDGSNFSFIELPSDEYSRINLIVVQEPIEADIEIKPKTLKLTSKGKWMNCRLWLPEDYNVAEIDPETVLLQRRVKADWRWFDEERQAAMFRFKRSEVAEILETGEVELTVTGRLTDGTCFEGSDTIKVIDKKGPAAKVRSSKNKRKD